MQILLGPAGSPLSSTLEGISELKRLGLQCIEVQFTHGINMSKELAKKIGEEAKRKNITLSIHAPYFINLNSLESEKITASKQRILKSCELGEIMGANYLVFHAGYYSKKTPDETYKIIKEKVLEIQKEINSKKWKIKLAIETTGKTTVFGSLEETIRLVKECKTSICVDFAHIYARQQGRINYSEIFDKLKILNLKDLHIHFSGIKFGKTGELNHEVMGKPDFDELAKEILKRKIDVQIISESPITFEDSLKQKKIFEKLNYKFI
ncbi:TIM barrel protein [Candidatus Woesearchaeota archaeon]|nr:TIM barrel protein [Candidatus Woesearchaeota archaeon]